MTLQIRGPNSRHRNISGGPRLDSGECALDVQGEPDSRFYGSELSYPRKRAH